MYMYTLAYVQKKFPMLYLPHSALLDRICTCIYELKNNSRDNMYVYVHVYMYVPYLQFF